MTGLRVTGMASGLDTDSLIKQLMKAERAKVDKVKQQRTVLEWQQEMYRTVISDFNTFRSTYFDSLKTDTYLLSSKNLTNFGVTNNSDTTNAVKITPSTSAVPGNYTLDVTQQAKKAMIDQTNVPAINGDAASAGLGITTVVTSANKNITINGEAIAIDEKVYSSPSEIAANINSKISLNVNLKNKVKAVASSDGKIEIKSLVEITDANKVVNVDVAGTPYTANLTKGFFTLDEIAKQINTSAKFPTGTEAAVSGNSINITGGNITNGASYTVSSPTLADTSASGAAFTDLTVDTVNQSLTFTKEFVSGVNDTLNILVGSTNYSVDLKNVDVSSQDNDTILNNIKNEINTALASTNVKADIIDVVSGTTSTKKLYFKADTKDQVVISGSGSRSIGIADRLDVSLSTSDKMANVLFDSSQVDRKVDFTINGVTFKYDFGATADASGYVGAANKTVSDILNDIGSKSGTEMTYNYLSRQFSMASTKEGASATLDAIDGGSTVKFLEKLFGSSTTLTGLTGQDATVALTDSQGNTNTYTQNSSTFTAAGINFTINSMPTAPITFTVSQNTDDTVTKIKGFLQDYNKIIDSINTKLTEKKQYSYAPLTDEQREAMKDTDITAWETKAKQGLLKGDSVLTSMLTQLRQAIYTNVDGAGISMSEIGITTSSNYQDAGKLVLDETKLKNALATKGDQVVQLFTKQTSSEFKTYNPDLSSADRKLRYDSEGVFNRIDDILKDSFRTTRNAANRKGTIIEKAGLKGDTTELTSYLSKYIREKDNVISTLNVKLSEKENKYYSQFANLEKVMSNLNSQSSWLSQQLGNM